MMISVISRATRTLTPSTGTITGYLTPSLFMRLLLIFFIILPIAEMAVLIKVGTLIGVLPTIALVVLTAVMGVSLMRVQGLATLARVQEKLQRGELPETELLEGVMLLIGGALLLTPGFITDTMGFICLIPGLRQPIARWIMARGMLGGIHVVGGTRTTDRHGHTTIEGEFRDEN